MKFIIEQVYWLWLV